MRPEDFTSFKDKKPKDNKHIIVTNNISATDAHGEMSHVWMTKFYTFSEEYEQLVSFDAADRMIYGLTHWKYA